MSFMNSVTYLWMFDKVKIHSSFSLMLWVYKSYIFHHLLLKNVAEFIGQMLYIKWFVYSFSPLHYNDKVILG